MHTWINLLVKEEKAMVKKSKKKITLLLNNFIISIKGTAKIENILYITYAYNNIILIYNDILYQRRNIVFERQGVRELWLMIWQWQKILRKIIVSSLLFQFYFHVFGFWKSALFKIKNLTRNYTSTFVQNSIYRFVNSSRFIY